MDIVVVGGIVVLVVLAVAIGALDRRDQSGAWRHIARERRDIAALRAELRHDGAELDRRRAELDRRERMLDLREELDG